MDTEELIFNWFETTKYADLLKEAKNSNGEIKNPYHIEDTVFDHIKMVYNEVVYNYKDKIDSKLYHTLLLSALCHDIAKPFVRDINQKGRPTFYNHESLGFFKATNLLYEFQIWKNKPFNLDKEMIENILFIVAHHDIYKYNKDLIMKQYRDKAELVYMFAICDANGRIVAKGYEKDLDYIKEIIDNANKEEWKPNEYKISQRKLIFLMGVPGSGKSTYIDKLIAENYRYRKEPIVISRDSIVENIEIKGHNLPKSYTERFKYLSENNLQSYVNQLVVKAYMNALQDKEGRDIIIDKVNTSLKTRRAIYSPNFKKPLVDIINNMYKECIIMTLPENILYKRLDHRNNLNDKVIETDIITKFMVTSKIPGYLEFDKITFNLDSSLLV